jgi:small redox-active disulfide protein 2
MKIQILGTGCSKCSRLTEQAELAAKASGLAYELEKVTDLDKIMAFGVMSTPALVVDGKVVSSGRVPAAAEIAAFLKKA